MPGRHEIETVEKLADLRELRSEWNEAAPPGCVEPWQSFSWIEAAATAYSKNHSLRVVTVRREGRLAAVAPLVLKPSEQPWRPLRLDFLGGEELKEPNRLISLDPVSLELLTDVIASERVYPIRLSRVPSDDEGIALLISKFKRAGWITRTLSMPYPYLDLGVSPIRKSLREDLRRARRKAGTRGEVKSWVAATDSKQELLEYLETGFRIEASGWKDRNGTAVLSRRPRREFFERYAVAAHSEGTLRLLFLTVDDVAVAVQFGVEAAKAYWLLVIGYDEKYRECSPGNLLMEDSIEVATRSGLGRYNLLGKPEAWVRRWTSSEQECLVLAAYRPNLHGVKAVISDALYLAMRGMKDRKVSRLKGRGAAGRKGGSR